jgi:DNA-binding transcriptional MerR regulator
MSHFAAPLSHLCRTYAAPMPILSISEAAKLAGIDRRTLQRQISRGILSVTTRSDGSRGIDPSELFRVYPDVRAAPMPQGMPQPMSQSAAGQGAAMPQGAAALQSELKAAQDKIASLERLIDELQQDKVWFKQQVEQLQLRLLPPPKKPFLEKLAEAWGRLRSR